MLAPALYSPDRSAVYALPVERPSDAVLLSAWLEGLYRARMLRGFTLVTTRGDHGVVFTLLVEQPTTPARVLLDVAFSGAARPLVIARLWALPWCVAGLAQDLERTVDGVRLELEALATAGLAYEHKGVWRARPLQRGGEG